MTLRTITFDDSTHKLVPLEPTDEWKMSLDNIKNQDCLSYEAIKNVIAAAPEYQDTCKFDRGMCGIGGYCKDCIQDTKKDE